MGIMDMFKFGAPAASAVPNGTPQPNLTQGLPTMAPQAFNSPQPGIIPGGELAPQAQEKVKSPFEDFEKLWDTPKQVGAPDAPIQFSIDAAKVNQSARQIDFTKTITPALLEKIRAGGDGSAEAMLQAMNEMTQVAFAQGMMANTKVLEAGLESSHQRVTRVLPDTIRKQTISNTLREENPLFSNPATAPLMQALQNQLTAQFPTASAAEIAEHARKYLVTFAGEAQKLDPMTQAAAKIQATVGRESDWSQEPI